MTRDNERPTTPQLVVVIAHKACYEELMRRWRTDIQYHPTIGYTYIPNLRAHLPHPERGAYRIATNASGFRCRHPFDRKTPKGTFRIALFGDSYTAGDSVDTAERFGNLLEDALTDVQVLNFGLSGSGTDQQLLTYDEYAADLEYDLLLVCPFVENIQRVITKARVMRSPYDGVEREVPKPYFSKRDAELVLHNVPVPLPKRAESHSDATAAQRQRQKQMRSMNAMVGKILKGSPKRVLKAAYQAVTSYEPVPEYRDSDTAAWDLMKAILEGFVERAGNRPVVFAPIPMRQHIDGSAAPHYVERFNELHAPPGVHVLDVLPYFQKLPLRERLLEVSYLEDWHWTPRGHAVMAEALQRMLSDGGLLG